MADFTTSITRSSAAMLAARRGRFSITFITGSDEGLILPDTLVQGRNLVNHAVRLLNGYMHYLRKAEKVNEEPSSGMTAASPDNN